MELLEGPIRRYAWGSHTAIAALQGRATPTVEPEAELWLGAHPTSPALLHPSGTSAGTAAGTSAGTVTGAAGGAPVPLTEVIAADADAVLGAATVRHYGPRLPFLLKVLAAAQPLSLQAHPDPEQAAAGYAAEEEAGIALDAPNRTYVDTFHKPEVLVAVEEFDALCGFRDPGASAELLGSLEVPALKSTVDALRSAYIAGALRNAVRGLLSVPEGERADLVAAVVAATRPRAAEHPAYALAGELAQRYPDDVGVVVAMLLNRVRLAPGEAVWMPAGNLHTYLHGVGVELMAASDNVLRGGLTPKPVNVPELLRILRFEVLADPVVRPRPVAPGVVTWPVPVSDFALYRTVVGGADGDTGQLPGGGPRVVLCLRGTVRVDDGSGGLTLRGGQAAFARASAGSVRVTGEGEVFQAGVG